MSMARVRVWKKSGFFCLPTGDDSLEELVGDRSSTLVDAGLGIAARMVGCSGAGDFLLDVIAVPVSSVAMVGFVRSLPSTEAGRFFFLGVDGLFATLWRSG